MEYLSHSVKDLMADSVNWLSQYLLHLPKVERLENKKLYVPYSLAPTVLNAS